MLTKYKKQLIITTLITLIPILVGVVLWNHLPDELATHFDINGNANGWSSKPMAVFVLPLFLTAVHLVCAATTMADPRRQNIQDKIFLMILWIIPILSMFVMFITYAHALGFSVNIVRLTSILMGGLFLVLGNYLPKCRQNYTVGIKLPWTLADPENWNRTHRLGGWVWSVGGLLFLLMAVIGKVHYLWMMGVIIGMVVIPTGYSYWYYVTHRK